MKGNSKFWLQNNAKFMLNLRCQWIAEVGIIFVVLSLTLLLNLRLLEKIYT